MAGKRRDMGLGPTTMRGLADVAGQVKAGIDPLEAKKAETAAPSR